MDDIKQVLARASKRLLIIDLLRTFAVTSFIVLCALFLARLTQKLVPTVEIPWNMTFVIAAGVALVSALIWAISRRPNEDQVAREIDDRAGLRETISTALCVDKNQDSWSKAIVTDASARAKRVVVKDTLPIESPKHWPMPVASMMAIIAIWWVPSTDITGLLAKKEQRQAQLAQVAEVRATVNETAKMIEEIKAQTGVDLDTEGDEAAKELTPQETLFTDPEEIARAAIKELTNLTDKLDEKRNNEDGATFDAIKDMTRQLNTPKPGAASEMARAMARGDFGEAKKKLEEMAEALEDGSMSEEQKKQAAEGLEAMKKQLEKMAANRQQLEEQLKAAGLSEQQAKQMATDPDALKKALQEAGATEEQAQQLSQAAKAQQRASDAAGSMAQAMGQMAAGMQQSNPSEMSQGLESMSGQLSDMENMQQEMQSLDMAMSKSSAQLAKLGECSGGSCDGDGQGFGEQAGLGKTGQFSEGNSQGFGKGSGGPGKGMGAGPDAQATDFMLKKERAEVQTTNEGPVIASTMVQGSQIRGESSATFSSVVKSASTQAAEAIETKRVPRKHEAAVQHYFGRLDNAAKKANGEKTTPAPSGSDATKSTKEDD
ncbi:MAG: hypothetical protein JKX70_05325 [Phycisphaerales bacterium]|nr:hypothetical protein [Phycisphaerales bacterium]